MENDAGTLSGPMTNWFSELLDEDDDAELWRVVLSQILAEIEKKPDVLVEVGRCSHWLRPHQSRWTANGGFASPVGYGSGSGVYSFSALPQFDLSIVLEWTGTAWELVKKRTVRHSVRVTIPSRTKRHRQAAVHTLWHTGREKEVVFYGFRKRDEEWVCTAFSKIG
jgi:hypothetical protein